MASLRLANKPLDRSGSTRDGEYHHTAPAAQRRVVMRITKKVVGALVTFVIATVVVHRVLGEAAVYFEMWSTGAASRGELANDFGLGLLWLFIVVPGSLVGAAVAGWWVWRNLSVRGADE